MQPPATAPRDRRVAPALKPLALVVIGSVLVWGLLWGAFALAGLR